MFINKYLGNKVFVAIREAGLEPSGFTLTEDGGVILLEHRGSQSAMRLSDAPRGYVAIDARVSGQRHFTESTTDWPSLLAPWLEDVKRDVETPDLWAEYNRQQELLSATAPHDADVNTPFSPTEQEEIAERLMQLGTYAAASGNFSDDEVQILNAKLDLLLESSKHSRRFDWREQLIGALLGAVVGNVLPSGATIDVLNMALRSVGHLLGHPTLELPR
jgi:hypothetical protein